MWKGFGIFLIVCIIFSGIGLGFRACHKAEEATHLHDAVLVYEEYQEIYNTCVKLNVDLGNMQSLPGDDVMFEQFSKAQRVNTIKTQLNKWIEIYNAKSKMWGRSLWKSSQLPYQLEVGQFSNYK